MLEELLLGASILYYAAYQPASNYTHTYYKCIYEHPIHGNYNHTYCIS